jgi:hypothetical protein
MLDEKLSGIRIDPKNKKTTIVAYADDVNILLTSQNEMQLIKDAINCYQETSGAKINLEKSKALAMGDWDRTDLMGINIKILGIQVHTTIEGTAANSWTMVTRKIRAQASEAYNRDLGLEQRIQYIHNYLLSKAWYVAQIFAVPTSYERQLNTAIAWYTWHGDIFKVPMSTLQRPKREGGWDLIHIATKSRDLYYHRKTVQRKKEESLTAGCVRHWGLHEQSKNPPNRNEIPPRMTYMRTLGLDSAYIEKQGKRESAKEYRRRIYNTLKTLLRDTTEPDAMRITRLCRERDWGTIWKNLHMAPIPTTTKGKWYCIIHDILPTNELLHKIRLSTTEMPDV